MHVSIGRNTDIQRCHVKVSSTGELDVFLSAEVGFITLSETEVGLVLKTLEERRRIGGVSGGESIVRLALADALRMRGIDADEYAAGLAWLHARK